MAMVTHMWLPSCKRRTKLIAHSKINQKKQQNTCRVSDSSCILGLEVFLASWDGGLLIELESPSFIEFLEISQ